ncbi:MAG: SPFH domain-containing protein [Kofleriaceae bacterium]
MSAPRRTTLAAVAIAALATTAACTNPEVPQGHEGYVYHQPLVFGKMEFRESLRGPATTGVSWRLYVVNVDMRAKSYKEDFELLTSDNLSVSFEVNTRIQLKDGSVKEIVEQWGGTSWYEWNVKEPLRTIVREQVTRFSATDIQLETPKVKELIAAKLAEKFGATPIMIESVDIGQIQFPSEVAEAISLKIAKKQELERQEFVLAKAAKEAAIRVLEALRVAKQQMIISSTLDPLYVQQRAVQVYRTIGASKNKTIIVLPNMPEGTGLPQVLTEGKRKVLTAADEQLLADMEERYMKEARKPTPLGGAAVDAPEGPEAGPGSPTAPSPTAPSPTAPSPAAPSPTASPDLLAPSP